MEAKVPPNLFQPGAGGLPPYLAGRDQALKALTPLEASLREGRAASRDAVIYGPRGNGKTVLMQEFLRRARDEESGIPKLQVLQLTPNQIPDLPALCQHLVLETPGSRLLDRIQALKRVDLSLSETGLPGLGIEFATPTETRLLPDILKDRARAGPTVIALDEAHNLDPLVGQTLLNLVQSLRSEDGCPVLLMMAGTPEIKSRLGAMKATFWDRCKKIPVGLLNEKDATAALAEPLKNYGVTFDDAALKEVVTLSNGYPYFVQLWGEALTRDLAEGERITDAHVNDARHVFDEEKNAYYAERYAELKRRGLIEGAEVVTPLFTKRAAPVGEAVILEAMEGHEDGGQFALDRLVQLGYIWGGPADGYVPGIPSLMDYVAVRAFRMPGEKDGEMAAGPIADSL